MKSPWPRERTKARKRVEVYTEDRCVHDLPRVSCAICTPKDAK